MPGVRPDIEQAAKEPFGTFAVGRVSRWFIRQIAQDKPGPFANRIRKLGRDWMRRSNEIADVTYDGFKFRLYPSENTCDMEICLYRAHSEEAEFEEFRQEIRGKQVFVDIGANIGIYSLIASRLLADNGRVIAFEPDPRTAAKLAKNLELNDVQSVEIVGKAVGPEHSEMQLFSTSWKNAGRNSLNPDIGKNRPSVVVRIVPLLDALTRAGVTKIDVLKIDVEGFEDKALLPFFEAAPRSLWPRYLMIEIVLSQYWDNDVVATLQSLGYQECFRNPGNIHFRLAN